MIATDHGPKVELLAKMRMSAVPSEADIAHGRRRGTRTSFYIRPAGMPSAFDHFGGKHKRGSSDPRLSELSDVPHRAVNRKARQTHSDEPSFCLRRRLALRRQAVWSATETRSGADAEDENGSRSAGDLGDVVAVGAEWPAQQGCEPFDVTGIGDHSIGDEALSHQSHVQRHPAWHEGP
jgi:hypothetical protein